MGGVTLAAVYSCNIIAEIRLVGASSHRVSPVEEGSSTTGTRDNCEILPPTFHLVD